MCLISHNHNVSAFRKAVEGFLELLHRGKNDAVRFSAIQQFFQMRPALGVYRLLPKEVFALGKLTVKLVVQIVAVRDNDNCRAVQRVL